MDFSFARKKIKAEELISYEVKELLNYRPHWIVRKGNILFASILLLLVALTWFIEYPDIINGPVRLIAVNSPRTVSARVNGKLQKLLVRNEQDVEQGTALAYLQSTASHEQVLQLKKFIDSIVPLSRQQNMGLLQNKSVPLLNELGEMQTAYQEFRKVMEETQAIMPGGYYQKKKKNLVADLRYISEIQDITERQKKLLQQDYELQQIEYRAKEQLSNDKVIAPLEFNQDKSKMIAKEQGIEQMSAQVINASLSHHNKEKELLELEKFIHDQQVNFQLSLLTLKSKADEWIQQYIVMAPVTGKVLFAGFFEENQLVRPNQDLFFVQPMQSTYYGELVVGQAGLGKIKQDQIVLVKPLSYPTEEFGHLKGKVAFISRINNRNDSFLIRVELPYGLQTNFKKMVYFRNNMMASGEIITNRRKLFSRLWGQLSKLVDR